MSKVLCIPTKSERRCETHDNLPLYPDGYCLEGKNVRVITEERNPICNCILSTEWIKRKYNGIWVEGDGYPDLEQRTCIDCGFTTSREIK